VPVTGGLLAFATVTTIVSQLFVGLSLVLLASFFRDEPLFGRNTPNLHTPKNSLVSLCSNGSLTKPLCTGRTPSLFLYSSYNILALGIFWLQHIVLAKTNVKRRLIARFPQYLAAERSLFNLSAALTLILSLYLYSPSRRDALFSLPEGFRPLFDLIQIAAGVLFIKGLLETDVHRDLFGVRSLRKLYRTDSLDYHELYEQRDTLEQQLHDGAVRLLQAPRAEWDPALHAVLRPSLHARPHRAARDHVRRRERWSAAAGGPPHGALRELPAVRAEGA
jgi:hypothetical protein